MKLDDTLIKIFTTIQQEVKDKYGIEYDIEDLHGIVNTQIEATKLGFSKGITVHWSRFCKFVFTDRANRKKETQRFAETVASHEDLLPHEKEQLIKEYIVATGENKRAILAGSRTDRHFISSTVEEVVQTETVNPVKTLMFTNIIRKHTK